MRSGNASEGTALSSELAKVTSSYDTPRSQRSEDEDGLSDRMPATLKKYDPSTLRERIVEESCSWRQERGQNVKITGRRRHEALLENYWFDDVRNLAPHFETLRRRTNISSSAAQQ